MAKRCSISGVLVGWFVVTGCGGESGASGAPNDEQTPPPEVSAYEALTECEAVEPCAGTRSFAQLIEGSSKYLDPGTACVLAALRDRTPGRYLHQSDSTWTNGTAGSNHVIVIRADGAVLYGRDAYTHSYEMSSEVSDPGKRCALKSESFFDACYAAVTSPGGDPDAAFTCAYTGHTTSSAPIDWFESCEIEAEPSCG